MLTDDVCSQFINIDYCSSLLYDLPDKSLTDYKELCTLLLVFFAEFLNMDTFLKH